MSGHEDTWNGQPFELHRSRVFEYTDDSIASSFNSLEDEQLDKLYSFPTLFCYEKPCQKDFRIGYVKRITQKAEAIVIDYQLDDRVAALPYDLLESSSKALEIEKFEHFRTHWAIKDVDLFEVLSGLKVMPGMVHKPVIEAVKILKSLPDRPTYSVQPQVFRLPKDSGPELLVSVMMPFDPAFDDVLEVIKIAANEVGFNCQTVRDVWENSEIIQDVFDLIFRSKIIVCDFSTKNSNVFYEAGIAHTLGRHVIPIAQSIDDVPFDLRHHRVQLYTNTEMGLREFSHSLRTRMIKLASL
jgi:hypothetical protein